MHPERIANPNAKRPKVTARSIDLLIEKAWGQGWWCKKGKKSHVLVYSPDGKGMVTLPSSPSDYRGVRNARLLLKKYGLDLKR